MKKYITIMAAVIAATTLFSSCEKDDIVTPNDRTPQRVEFKARVLQPNYIIGNALPKEAEAVDLGLSVKWANMDVDSKGAFDMNGDLYGYTGGKLYSWGTIVSTQQFSWESYEHNDYHPGPDNTRLYLTRYCFDQYGEKQDLAEGGVTLDKNDDVAYLHWGEGWRMPTKEEFAELIEKCKWTVDDVKTPEGFDKVITVTGPNGNSIKISQNASLRLGHEKDILTSSTDVWKIGFWTSTLDTRTSEGAAMANIDITEKKGQLGVNAKIVDRLPRFVGLPIRAVHE